jgi:LemA protein
MSPSPSLLVAASLSALGLLLGAWAIRTYRTLVELRQKADRAFAQVDEQLKRRHELIPNLTSIAQGYLAHEGNTLESLIAARAAAAAAGTNPLALAPVAAAAMLNRVLAEQSLTGALARLMTMVEAYPELKADRLMEPLLEELRTTENRVAFARQAANDAVTDYNTRISSFPTLLLANPLGFAPAPLFELIEPAAQQVPRAG